MSQSEGISKEVTPGPQPDKRRAAVIGCQSLQMQIAYLEKAMGIDCRPLLQRMGWDRAFAANISNLYTFDEMVTWVRAISAAADMPAARLLRLIGASGFTGRRLNFIESVVSRTVVGVREVLRDMGYWGRHFNKGYQKLRAFPTDAFGAVVVSDYDPVFDSEGFVEECAWTEGLLAGFPVLLGQPQAAAREVICSLPLSRVLSGSFAGHGLDYSERGGRVWVNGRRIGERVLVGEEVLSKTVRSAVADCEAPEPWEPLCVTMTVESGARTRLSVVAQTAEWRPIADWLPYEGLSEAELRQRSVALLLTEDVCADGKTLIRKGSIFNARHCRFDVEWESEPGLLIRIWHLLKTCTRHLGWRLAGETPWSLQQAQLQLRDSEEKRLELQELTRTLESRVEEAVAASLHEARRLSAAEAQLATGKAYAASAAHDINNALGPARSGIEEILRVLREARPAREEHQSEAEAAEADFARQLGKVIEAELAGIAEALAKVAGSLSRPEAELLLDRLEFLARVSWTMREAIPDIYRGINRASDYTSFMSEMARVDYAQEREAVRLDELLGELVEKYRRLWERQGIELEQELSGEATVLGWRHVLESVFSNLLDNAAKALQESEEKRVRVVLSREGERCVVAVEDTGPGIAKELREKVFELGYTTHPADGKGFGLAYVKNYVTLLGGRVSAEDRPEGGAAFVVQIPVSEAAEGTGQ